MDDIPSYQIARDGKVIGTFTVLEVEKRRRSKVSNDILGDLVPDGLFNKLNEHAILPTDQFWREGMSDWRPMSDFEPEILAHREAEKRWLEAEKKRLEAEQQRAAQAAIEAENARLNQRVKALAERRAKEAEEAAARRAIAERLAQERARVEREKAEQAKAEAAQRREWALGEQWYFLEGDKRMGPVSGSQILQLQAEARLSVDTLICPKTGEQKWMPLHETALGDGAVPPPPTMVKGRPTSPKSAHMTQVVRPPQRTSSPDSVGATSTDDNFYYLIGYGGAAALLISALLPFYRVGPIGISMMQNGGTPAGFLLLALAAFSGFACAQRSSSGLQISGALGVAFLIYQVFVLVRLSSDKASFSGDKLGEAIMTAISPQPDIGFVALILACVLLFFASSRTTR